MTNAFTARHNNQEKIEELYRSIAHVLDEMSSLREESDARYQEYLYQLKKILPRKEECSIPGEIIAARLSDDEDEQRAIRASLRGLAYIAQHKREGEDYNKKHPDDYDTRGDFFSAMPTLKTAMRTTTRHFAELDDNGFPIRKWDVEKSTTTYYLDEKKG